MSTNSNKGRALGYALGAAALACACAYCGLVYYQGQKFTQYAEEISKSSASDGVKIEITNPGFFTKEFVVSPKKQEPDWGDLRALGVVEFGFSPASQMRLSVSGNDALRDFLDKAQPLFTGHFNYRFLPKDLKLSSKHVELSHQGATLRMGAIDAVSVPKFASKNGREELDSFKTTFKVPLLAYSDNESNFTLSNPLLTLNVTAAGNKNAVFSLNFEQLDVRLQDARFSFGKTELTGSGSENKEEITQTLKLNFEDLNAKAGFIKVDLNKWDTGFKAHFPANPVIFNFLAQRYLGLDFCERMPLFCSPKEVTENDWQEAMQESILSGSTWLEIEPSEITRSKEKLSFSGRLQKAQGGSGLGSIKISLQTQQNGLGQYLLMLLPPNGYRNEGKGLYTTTIDARLLPNDNIEIQANGVTLR